MAPWNPPGPARRRSAPPPLDSADHDLQLVFLPPSNHAAATAADANLSLSRAANEAEDKLALWLASRALRRPSAAGGRVRGGGACVTCHAWLVVAPDGGFPRSRPHQLVPIRHLPRLLACWLIVSWGGGGAGSTGGGGGALKPCQSGGGAVSPFRGISLSPGRPPPPADHILALRLTNAS